MHAQCPVAHLPCAENEAVAGGRVPSSGSELASDLKATMQHTAVLYKSKTKYRADPFCFSKWWCFTHTHTHTCRRRCKVSQPQPPNRHVSSDLILSHHLAVTLEVTSFPATTHHVTRNLILNHHTITMKGSYPQPPHHYLTRELLLSHYTITSRVTSSSATTATYQFYSPSATISSHPIGPRP